MLAKVINDNNILADSVSSVTNGQSWPWNIFIKNLLQVTLIQSLIKSYH